MNTKKAETHKISISNLKIFEYINKLKNLYRQGWLASGIAQERCESIADHSYSLALLCLHYAENYNKELDLLKVLKMSLIHDLGECIVGDIIPNELISEKIKYEQELKAISAIFGRDETGTEFVEVWKEFERAESSEAKYVKQMDKIEMLLQALDYHKQENVDLQQFFDSTEEVMSDKFFIELREEIIKEYKG